MAMVDPVRAPRPGGSAGKSVDLGRHQPLAGIGQQLADQVRIGTLLERILALAGVPEARVEPDPALYRPTDASRVLVRAADCGLFSANSALLWEMFGGGSGGRME